MMLMSGSYITIFVGACFVILAGLRLFGIELDKSYLISLSLAALFFAASDFLEFIETGSKVKSIYKKFKFDSVKSKFLAVFSIIVLPHLPVFNKMDQNSLEAFSDYTSLFSLGIAISLIGLKDLKSLGSYMRKTTGINEHLAEKADKLEKIFEKNIDDVDKKLNDYDKSESKTESA